MAAAERWITLGRWIDAAQSGALFAVVGPGELHRQRVAEQVSLARDSSMKTKRRSGILVGEDQRVWERRQNHVTVGGASGSSGGKRLAERERRAQREGPNRDARELRRNEPRVRQSAQRQDDLVSHGRGVEPGFGRFHPRFVGRRSVFIAAGEG